VLKNEWRPQRDSNPCCRIERAKSTVLRPITQCYGCTAEALPVRVCLVNSASLCNKENLSTAGQIWQSALPTRYRKTEKLKV
jgi:hypothetical protein